MASLKNILQDKNGKVGIGTYSPSEKLHVVGRVMAEGTGYTLNPTSPIFGQYTSTRAYVQVPSSGQFEIWTGGTSDIATFYNNRNVYFSGNVGIGTTSPSRKLEVQGDFYANGTNGALTTELSQSNLYLLNLTRNTTSLITAGSVGIGTTSPGFKLQVNHGTGAEYVASFRNTNDNLQLKIGTTTGNLLNIQGATINTNAAYNIALQADGGNVGIGTTSPTYKLQVNGTAYINETLYVNGETTFDGTSNFNTNIVNASAPYASGDEYIKITNPNENSGTLMVANNGNTWLNADGGKDLWLNWYSLNSASSKADLRVGDGYGGTLMSVIGSSGNVGIGTTSPNSKLDVSLSEGTYIRASNASFNVSANNHWGFGLYEGTSLSAAFRIVRDGTGDQVSIGTANNQSFAFWQNNTERMRVAVGGNVGIGITSPSHKLHIEGAIGVKRVSVNATSTIDMEGNFNFDASSGYSHVFKQAGSEILRITETGKMGINTTNPKGKFWVQGDTSYFTSSTNGVSSIVDSQSCAIVVGPATTRNGTAGTYMAGIGFDHLLNYGSQGTVTYSTSAGPHAWVGIRLYATPGYEQSDLVFATRSSTSSGGATVERMTVSALGNVGIGTSSPSYRLSVSGADNNIVASFDHTSFVSRQVGLPGRFMVGPLGNGYPEIGYNFTTASSTYSKIINDTAWSINFGNGSRMSFKYAGAGTGEFSFTEYMVINSSGNVGIGTTSPQKKLDVRGGYFTTSDGGTNEVAFVQGGNGYAYFGNLNSGKAAFGNSENWTTLVADGGNVGIGTTSPSHKLQVQNGNIGLYSDSYGNTGMLRLFGTDNSEKLQVGSLSSNGFLFSPDGIGLSIYTGGSENVRITSGGNVGIGTTSPQSGYKLDVRGNILAYYANVVAQGLVSGYGLSEQRIGPDGTSASSKPFIVYTSGGFTNERLRIDTSGNVGIGTTSPAYKLDVSGGAIAIRGNAAGNSLRFDDSLGTSRNAMYVDTSNYLNVGNANYAGLKLYHTASQAPSAGGFSGESIAEAFGSTENGRILGEPSAWLEVRVGTTDYVIPMFATG